jgi:hypothetical protein
MSFISAFLPVRLSPPIRGVASLVCRHVSAMSAEKTKQASRKMHLAAND